MTGAIVAFALAVAPAAGAATINACASKKSGAMRIVSAKAKCKRGEHKLSWSSTGPAGPAGAPGAPGAAGAPGAPGANGVGVDYSSFSYGPNALALSETGDIVITKAIPAGTYFVSGKAIVGGTSKTKSVLVAVLCELVDSSSTPHLMEPMGAIDVGEWVQQLSVAESGTEWVGATTMEMQGQLTTTVPSTLALVCDPLEGSTEATLDAFASQVSALQTTANK